ncbi:MAG: exodeoxyribonuclease VII small subunit [Chlamydiota bacterium]
MTDKEQQEVQFEKAFERLEDILETMNSGNVPLEEALKLYEEADKLIAICQGRLSQAEKKVEVLIKNRQGGLATDENSQPLTQDFPFSEQP